MSQLTEFRTQKDKFFANDHHSPLRQQQRDTFKGLAYFGEDSLLHLEVQVEEYSENQLVEIATSTGDVQTYERWGRFTFEV